MTESAVYIQSQLYKDSPLLVYYSDISSLLKVVIND